MEMKDHTSMRWILIVDDEPDIRTLVCDYITEKYPTVKSLQAENGTDALKKASNQKFDLIITDIQMPKMNGKDFLRSLTGLPKEFKPEYILIVSAFIGSEARISTKKGSVSTMAKPLELSRLSQYMEDTLFHTKQKNSNFFDVNFVNPFIEATLSVLETLAGVKATKDFTFIREDSDMIGDISALLPINSQKYKGSLSITFEAHVYLKVVGQMMGETYTQIDVDNRDGVAEICNQVYCRAKNTLNQTGYGLGQSIPSIIVGRDHQLIHTVDAPIVATYFNTEFGNFVIEATMKKL